MVPGIQALAYATRLVAARLRGEPLLTIASIYPTHRCNLRCVYCSSPLRKTPELSTAAWLRIVDELADLGCRRVAILGGEPLLRADVPELIDGVRDRGMSCVLTSNGLLVPRQIDRLRRLSTLVLSLDAPGPANDEVRGAGVFEAVGEAIAAARSARVPVKLNAVLSAKTAIHLEALLDFVEQQNLHVTVNVMRSGAPDLWRDAARIRAEDDDVRRLLERLAAKSRDDRRLLFSPTTYRYAARWGEYARDRVEDAEVPPSDARRRGAPRCQAGRYYVTIDPDGTVYPCALTVGRIRGGNAAIDGVKRAILPLRDHSCVACYSPCLVEQNFLFSLNRPVLWHFARRHLRRFA
jgi:MoaA/NifB/PqqE/SkfB family radical SAM enzyme